MWSDWQVFCYCGFSLSAIWCPLSAPTFMSLCCCWVTSVMSDSVRPHRHQDPPPQTLGSPVPGTLQARTLEWFAISFSNAWKWKVKVKSLCRSQLLVTLWTTAYQAPPSMGFSRQEYWSGVPLPSPPLYHRRPLTEKIGYTSLINQLLLSITCQSRNQ